VVCFILLFVPADIETPVLQSRAVERENPKLPTKESDKPVQFWQLKKNGSKVRTALHGINIHLESHPVDILLQSRDQKPSGNPPSLGQRSLVRRCDGIFLPSYTFYRPS